MSACIVASLFKPSWRKCRKAERVWVGGKAPRKQTRLLCHIQMRASQRPSEMSPTNNRTSALSFKVKAGTFVLGAVHPWHVFIFGHGMIVEMI